jgi:hypothetical protein
MAQAGKCFFWVATAALAVFAAFGAPGAGAEDETAETAHAECTFFSPAGEKFRLALPGRRQEGDAGRLTDLVAARLGVKVMSAGPSGPRNAPAELTIDRHIFQALEDAGVAPAAPATDLEFARRVTLDLTGRIPAVDRLLAFLKDGSPNKREKLVDELLASDEWVDRWTMFLGDLLKNTDRINSQGVVRYPEGRNAFYRWIRAAVAANRPWNRIASDIIAAKGKNSWEDGEAAINWLVGGIVSGGPQQDIWDQQAANVAETFLGLGHMNCVLCHDGRGHLDSLSLWGKSATRYSAWGMAAFFSRTTQSRTPAAAGQSQPYYWAVNDNLAANAANYRLNTSTGNRPARRAIGSVTEVKPVYPFSGNGPTAGENYRDALAREVTADFQFARAMVNRIWKEFFVIGLVEPVDQFDPARLDPDRPPPEPWKLQPSNPRLLNALAQDFIDSGYDLKQLMRQIVTSRAYQLSSRYPGSWNPAWDKLYARKLVRRLWAEEIHDAVAQASNVFPSYRIADGWTVRWAMQLPEPRNLPGGAATAFLDSFLRGNREDQERRLEGSPSQALSLMNDSFVVTRTRAQGSGASASLLARYINGDDDQLIQGLFLTVLSRFPTEEESRLAASMLKSGNRTQQAENLLWALFNKVDFIFNY